MTGRINLHDLARLTAEERARLMVRAEAELSAFVELVRRIVDQVREGGDEAAARLGRELDGADLAPDRLLASEAEFDAAFRAIEPEVRAAIEYAIQNIRRFHERQKPEPMWLMETRPGAFAGERWTAIPSVACYVPRGKGAFPSVMMMTTVPAVIAGVRDILVLTPPTPEGGVDAASLVAARLAGVERVYKAGGAVAAAVAAFGTATVTRCAKIVGPGSPWLVAAKKLLADRIDTGLPAGPSEAVILADASADPAIAALDLLIEAEHGPDSSAYLVTDTAAIAEGALRRLPELIARLGPQRRGFVEAVLGGPRGGVVLAPSWDEAVRFANDMAPEHLEILADEPLARLHEIEHAGEILLGPHTPITIANFVLGPDCVLPTGGHARTWSPLSVFDFMKRSGIGHVTARAYPELAAHARTLAAYEGFEAHAQALSPLREEAVSAGAR